MSIEEHKAARAIRRIAPDCRVIWKSIGAWVTKAKLDGMTWPDWCLVPDDFWVEVVEASPLYQGRTCTTSMGMSLIDMAGHWRLSKGIYRFCGYFKSELMSSTVSGNIPTDVLKRLPEWGVYLEMDGVFESDEYSDVDGVWIRLGYNMEHDYKTLIVVLSDGESLKRYTCPLQAATISQMVDACIDKQREQLGRGQVNDELIKTLGLKESQIEMLSKVMNALLYICSEEPDIEDHEEPDAKPTLARSKLVGKRDMFVAADRVRVWNVGEKIGEQIRQYNDQPADRKHTRRHLRRAHWHGYWIGPRGSDERMFTYKWLSPMVVGVN